MAKRKVKDTYWHSLAGFCILQGMKPAQIAKIVKEAFPQTSVTGRHIGAYKRRMVSDGALIPDRPTMSVNDSSFDCCGRGFNSLRLHHFFYIVGVKCHWQVHRVVTPTVVGSSPTAPVSTQYGCISAVL